MRLKQRHERAVLGIDALDDADLAIEYAGVVVVYELDDAIARTHGCAVAPTWPTGRVITCGSGAALRARGARRGSGRGRKRSLRLQCVVSGVALVARIQDLEITVSLSARACESPRRVPAALPSPPPPVPPAARH